MRTSIVTALALLLTASPATTFAEGEGLKAGAAKVDITPAEDALPPNYLGILDRIHSRAVVVEDNGTVAALISVDAGGIPDHVWQGVSQRLETELDIPATNVLISATHSHSIPTQPSEPYIDKIVESVRIAKAKMVPARIGFGTGVSYLNVNRNIIDPETHTWWEGANYDGPSDKTVAVIELETRANGNRRTRIR